MNDSLPNYFLLLNIFFLFFFVSSLSAPSEFFLLFCMLSKKDNHNFQKQTRKSKFENKSKNALLTGHFHLST